MTQLYASVAIGTAATLLAAILVLLRAKFQGRRPFVALTRRWIAASTRTSGLVLGLLAVIAISCFASIRADEENKFPGALDLGVDANAPSVQGMVSGSDESSPTTQALESLRAYADKIDAKRQSTAATPPAPGAVELPDVNTMIANLIARLEKQPNDVKGWKMLGWSYLNTDRPEEAATAYETALKLEPSDLEIRKALDQAKSAQTAAPRAPPSDPETSPTADDVKAAEGQSDTERNSMIRGMVDRLATRLETSPNDEDGWLRLMRSRMTLGEKDAAKAALTKALETFAGDAAAKGRLTAAARELGVESN
jgi:cytochrome c-type biogenesis protein CcmH